MRKGRALRRKRRNLRRKEKNIPDQRKNPRGKVKDSREKEEEVEGRKACRPALCKLWDQSSVLNFGKQGLYRELVYLAAHNLN